MAADKLGSTHVTEIFDLPHHLIFSKILLPTKAAVQLSFVLSQHYWNENVVSSSVLDFGEDDDFDRHNHNYNQHKKFVRFLEGYFEHYREKSRNLLLDKLRLKLRMYCSEDAKILDQWLELALKKGVKELDISCPILEEESGARPPRDKSTWYLNWIATFANAKSLTSLKLEGVKLPSFQINPRPFRIPSLKIMSLNALQFEADNQHALYYLLSICHALEFLTLTDFHFPYSLYLPKSLKSLELLNCERPKFIDYEVRKHEPDMLESVTFVGIPSRQPATTFYWPWLFSLGGKSLSYVNLQSIQIAPFPDDQPYKYLFPSLKTIFFTNMQQLDYRKLLNIILKCPSLECLSLTECSFLNDECHVSSSSLKSLKFKNCSLLRLLQVDEAKNLESFEFLSTPSSCEKVILNNSFNLKNINICVDDLQEFSLNGHRYMSKSMDSLHRIVPSTQIKMDIVLRKRHKRDEGQRHVVWQNKIDLCFLVLFLFGSLFFNYMVLHSQLWTNL